MVNPQFTEFNQSIKPFNRYSQFGEDGVIEAIFAKIGTANKWCVECGAADGFFFSNTRKLIEEQWSSLQIEADAEKFAMLEARYHDSSTVHTENVKIGSPPNAHSFAEIFARYPDLPTDFDLLVIDVDSQDYHLWNQLLTYQPRVVICEFDPSATPDFIPEIGGPGQAGERAIHHVALARGYQVVCKTQCNLICVRNDLCHFLSSEIPAEKQMVRVAAVASTPRLGFLTHSDCILQALTPFQIPLLRGEGAYWSQTLTRAIEKALELPVDYVLTLDYDTVFNQADVARLICALHDNPDYDVAVSMQQKREGGELLATSDGEVNMNQPLIPITRGQFALTLIRRSVFEKLALPWFKETPGPDGRWNEGRIDADIGFWQNCIESGVKVGLAMDVVVGHLELMITWPDLDRLPHYQHINAWRDSQMQAPVEAFSRVRLVERAVAAKGGQEWTTEYPTQPGVYWIRNYRLADYRGEHSETSGPSVVEVDPKLGFDFIGDDRGYSDRNILSAEWFGPVAPPRPGPGVKQGPENALAAALNMGN